MNVLISGFEPFNNMSLNPSQLILEKLNDSIEGAEIHTVLLPVSYKDAFRVLKQSIDEINPDIVISLGVANGRTGISLERIAININSSSIEDNTSTLLTDEAIVKNGELAYLSTLPIRDILNTLKEDNIPSHISNTAGTYICNNVMYQALSYVRKDVLSGFIHVPLMKGMENEKNHFEMEFSMMVRAVELAIQVSVKKIKKLQEVQ